ncbi:phosphoethanolamine transferase [Cobetia sp. 1AS1]|uniref:phosphoethanolamine transferase n=1 Tax=Cobetia sp. 1AS1 TaxID=3040016 RepID=UPI00244A681E|nr:phosphoethanolamine transferase [Cobetia sp. 1AS1]MDH2293972.1 sulfatase-like hydrolase/transferase [Cobetia sp. 1AS1]
MKGLLQRLLRRLFARSDQASKRAGVISAITLALLASLVPLIYHGLLEGGLILFGNLLLWPCLLAALHRPRWRWPALGLMAALGVNLSASVVSAVYYDSRYGLAFALSSLDTSRSESMAMLFKFPLALIVPLGFFLLALSLGNRFGAGLARARLGGRSGIAFVLWMLMLLAGSWQWGRASVPLAITTLSVSPGWNLATTSHAWWEKERYKALMADDYDFGGVSRSPEVSDDAVFVLIIGESQRRDQLSLYGYSRATTPNLDARRDELVVFDQAIAPAPQTVLAVPMLASLTDPRTFSPRYLDANLISLANQAGYHTEWLSRQGLDITSERTWITAIAQRADVARTIMTDYDDGLLDALDEALARDVERPRLIVLHLYGSHPPASLQYPDSLRYFLTPDSRSPLTDAYDDSIRFTDQVIEGVFQRLEGRPAGVLYLSDHGLEHDPLSDAYVHGGDRPSQAPYRIPLWLWQTGQAPNPARELTRLRSHADEPFASFDLPYLASDWLGIRFSGDKPCLSPWAVCYQPRERHPVLDQLGRLNFYEALPSDFLSRPLAPGAEELEEAVEATTELLERPEFMSGQGAKRDGQAPQPDSRVTPSEDSSAFTLSPASLPSETLKD